MFVNNSKKMKKKVPVDVLCSVLAFVLTVQNSFPNKTPMMLDLMCAQFEKVELTLKPVEAFLL